MKKILPAFIVIAALAGTAGAFLYQGIRPAVSTQASATPSPVETQNALPPVVTQPSQSPKTTKRATVYRVIPGVEHAELAPTRVSIPANAEPMAAALNAMAKLKSTPLPPDSHARSVTLDADGVATVDFNAAFRDNFPGGDEAEAIALNAVVGTLAHFRGVEKVQITVEGRKIDSLGGTQDLKTPLPVRDTPVASASTGSAQ